VVTERKKELKDVMVDPVVVPPELSEHANPRELVHFAEEELDHATRDPDVLQEWFATPASSESKVFLASMVL
jgi:hypothetical protein